jgi:hypothetical protein
MLEAFRFSHTLELVGRSINIKRDSGRSIELTDHALAFLTRLFAQYAGDERSLLTSSRLFEIFSTVERPLWDPK